MPYSAIIFDLDGVICSTDQYHYQAWKGLADRLDIPFDERVNNRLRGVSRMESLEIILERSSTAYTDEEKAAFAAEKNAVYVELLGGMSPRDLSDEVSRTLHALRERGLVLAIGSSSRNAGLILRQIGLAGFFDAVADGNGITHSKPHPEVFLLAADLIGKQPGECLVVEDAVAGLQAAMAAGMDCAAIGDAATSPLATYRLESLAGLLEIVSRELPAHKNRN